MLRPEFFDSCADDILALYAKLEESIIADMCRRIARMGRISDATAWQAARLQEAGTLYDNIIKEIAKTTNNREETVKKAFGKAGVEALSIDDSIYKAAGLDPLPLKQSQAMLSVLQAGLIKTNSVMQNLTMTTAVSTQQAYMQACDLAYMQVSTGAMDYRTAITRAVVSACEQGATVLYPKGHVDKLDVAIRRAVLTGVNQTCGKLQEARADEMECDLVETTAHAGARPSHAAWQGKVFSRSGLSDKYPPLDEITGYGTGAGLCGWNCRHSFFPYFEGLSESAYPREVLNEYNNRKVTINGEKMSYYDATQLQRKMERSIRESRRTLKGIDEALKEDPENFKLKGEFAIQSVKLKEKEAAMSNFIYKANLQKDSSRVWSNGFGKSVSQKAVLANKVWKPVLDLKHNGVKYGLQFIRGLEKADKHVAAALEKAVKGVKFSIVKPISNDPDSYTIFGYRSSSKTILINSSYIGMSSPALAHELFHSLDNNLNLKYNFNAALKFDYAMLKRKAGGDVRNYIKKTYPNAFETPVKFKYEYAGISDIISAMTKDKINFGYGHDAEEYWLKYPSTVFEEPWAEFGFTLYDNSSAVSMLEELFPNFYKKAWEALKEIA